MALKGPIKILASLRMAVFIILGLAVISAVGTIVEARFNDANVAQELVYRSLYMYGILGLLCVTLIAVMVDRWPWKQHHAGFVLAHVGILVLLFGAWLTQRYGVDGSLSFGVGEGRRQVTLQDRNLSIYSSLDGDTMREIYETPANFLKNPPTAENPLLIHLGQDEMRFTEYQHFAFRQTEIVAGDSENDGPAIRFQLENPNVNVTQWLNISTRRDSAELDLGPAVVSLSRTFPQPNNRNQIMLVPGGDNELKFWIFGKDGKLRKEGRIKQSETIETGWMGLKFRLLRYLPRAREVVRFEPAESGSRMTVSALKFTFQGREHWLGVNSVLRLYLPDRAFLVSYGQKQLELPFELKLQEFRVGKYEGTDRAASYESSVAVSDGGPVLISMNEPLHHHGFTFYQSSFESNERGEPVASILSVNYDPGRWIKYLGSLFIVAGAVVLFYFKRVKWIRGRVAATPNVRSRK